MATPLLGSIDEHIDTSRQRLDSAGNTMHEADLHLAGARRRIESRRAWLVATDSRQHRTIYADAAPLWDQADPEDLAESAAWATTVQTDGDGRPGELPVYAWDAWSAVNHLRVRD